MKTVICAIAIVVSAVALRAHAAVPPGPDSVNGAFVRLLAQEATTTAAVAAVSPLQGSDRTFEHWVNRVARNETSSAEAGFAHMLARCADRPAPLAARGEPDAVAVMIAGALRAQRVEAPMLARGGS